jgi:hypothetical protein
MLISTQLAMLSQLLGRLDMSHIVIPAQREELIEILSTDLSEGVRRIARAVSYMEAMIGPEALEAFADLGVTADDIRAAFGPVRVSTADIIDLREVLAREARDRAHVANAGGPKS